MFLRYRSEQEPLSNGLKNPTNDPAIPLPEESEDPSDHTQEPTANQYLGGNHFHHPMNHTSRFDSTAAYNMLPGREHESDTELFNAFINYDDEHPEKAPETAVKMELGPSESSDSSDSSLNSSPRQKSNNGSPKPSTFAAITHYEAQMSSHGLPDDWLQGDVVPAGNTKSRLPQSSEIDSMNQMAYKLAVDSSENSPTDSVGSNAAAGNVIAAMAMPNDLSQGLFVDPATTTDTYPEASINSSEASPVIMNYVPPAFAWPANPISPYANPGKQIQPQHFNSAPQTCNREFRQWCSQDQPSSATLFKQKCQELIYLSQEPRPDRPDGRYFDLKSNRTGTRVETALDVRLTLTNPPAGIMRLRIHEDHLTKVKHLKDRHMPLSPDALELRATVFCHTAMQTTNDIQDAMIRAASREVNSPSAHQQVKAENSPAGEPNGYRPLEGAPVRICEGCVAREAKRLRRSKPKPEETEEWLFNASHRTLVFNNGPIVDWKFPNSTNAAAQLLAQPSLSRSDEKDDDGKKRAARKLPPPPVDEDTMAVDLAMRICCYCRHQHEPSGFRVVFTLTDYLGQVYDQQITNPVMITDDHKDKEKKDSAPTTPPGIAEGLVVAGHYNFQSGPAAPEYSTNLQQSYSTPNLPTMAKDHSIVPQQNLLAQRQFAASRTDPYYDNKVSQATSGTLTPQTRSRQASPTGFQEPQPKKRKASDSGRMLEQLRMTPMQGTQTQYPRSPSQSFVNGPNGTAVTARRPAQGHLHRSNRSSNSHLAMGYMTNPPSPNHGGFPTFTDANRSQSMGNFSAAMFSTPASNCQSRAHSPIAGAFTSPIDFQPDLTQALDHSLQAMQATDPYAQQRPTSQPRSEMNGQTQQMTAPQPHHEPIEFFQTSEEVPNVEELIPDTGSIEGGTNCVFLGTGFHPNLQVWFGQRRATSVRIRHGTSLTCCIPPGERPGQVAIRFGQQNPQRLPSPSMETTHFYRYVASDRQNGVSHTVRNQSQNQSSEDLFDYSQTFRSYSAENSISQYSQHPNMPQHRYNSSAGQGFTETPPSYRDVLAEDDQRKLDVKTRSTLAAVGEALLDQKASERFDTTTTVAESSKVMRHVTIGSHGMSDEEKEMLRAERNRKAKGLRSDRKLWSIWIPILILVMITMLYDRFPTVWRAIVTIFSWIRDTVSSTTTRWSGYTPHHQQDQHRVMEIG